MNYESFASLLKTHAGRDDRWGFENSLSQMPHLKSPVEVLPLSVIQHKTITVRYTVEFLHGKCPTPGGYFIGSD